MEHVVNIDCFKISNKLNLALLKSYFDISANTSDYIQLGSYTVSNIIKVYSSSKSLFIYNYGCIVFVNFTPGEINLTLKYLESIIGIVDYKLISAFSERLRLLINDSRIMQVNSLPCSCEYNKDILSFACKLISRSTALASLEVQVINILDKAENIVVDLQKLKLRAKTKSFLLNLAHIARFQHSTIKALGLYDNSFPIKRNTNIRNFFNILSQYYEIEERTGILESKIDEVSKLVTSYATLSYNRQEIRLLLFECILLSIFLLPHFIK